MSIPLSHCMLIRAIEDEDSQALEVLSRALQKNLEHGAFTLMPCHHNPPCRAPTDEEMNELGDRLMEMAQDDGSVEAEDTT